MQLLTTSESQFELSRALRQMRAALDILDELHGPFDIASHLDLAICRLEQVLATGPHAQTCVGFLISQLENELTMESSAADEPADRWELQPI
jgi:hypothetical protein